MRQRVPAFDMVAQLEDRLRETTCFPIWTFEQLLTE
jgi:hypothetical protein